MLVGGDVKLDGDCVRRANVLPEATFQHVQIVHNVI